MTRDIADVARRCLLAGALGDAWGGPYEGGPARGIAPFPAVPRVSDDTWLTLATCDAIARGGGRVSPEEIAASFVSYFQSGRLTGLGSATSKALRDLAAGAHWALSGASGEFAAGNGAAMRIAPLAFLLDPAIDGDRRVLRDVARITHRNEEAYAGAVAVVAAVRAVALGAPGDLLERAREHTPDSAVRDRIEELQAHEEPPTAAAKLGNSGHVVDAVPLALYVARFHRTSTLEAALAEAAGLGGDADTIASIAGQILGAGVADGDLPWPRIRQVAENAFVEAHVDAFARALSSAPARRRR